VCCIGDRRGIRASEEFVNARGTIGRFISGDAMRCLELSLGFVALGIGFPLLAAECPPADVVLTNGHIITMDGERRVASALAIRDSRIEAIGTNQEVAACEGRSTRKVDLKGQTVLPGFIDVHTHAILWAESIVRGEIDAGYPAVHTIREIQTAVAEKARTTKPGDWVRGSRWDDSKLAEHRYLSKEDLDTVAPGVPVYLTHVSGHLAVANHAALKAASIDRNTPDPPGGIIEHDANGEPTGIVKDNAMRLVEAKLPADPNDTAVRAVKVVSDQAAAVGLTTIHDVWGGGGVSSESLRAYQDAYQRGLLKIRVQLAPGVASIADAERLALSGVHTGFGDNHLKFGAVKMFADGGMAARTIAIYPPGLQENGKENLGLQIWSPKEMQKAHGILARAGWQLSTHAIGDRAIDEVITSYAAVTRELGLQQPRFRIIHCGVSTPVILKRLHDEHVLVDGDPAFVYWIGAWFKNYGPQRERWAYPGKSYFDYGVVAAAGSDVPVTPISPWWGLWAAVERKNLNSGQVLAPEERLSVLQALELFTRNPAYIGFEEKEKGSLETDKLADLIVIDRDVLAVPSEQLKDVQVLQTWVGGELIYEKH
jgi:predicted amidohydrolase YtcJ